MTSGEETAKAIKKVSFASDVNNDKEIIFTRYQRPKLSAVRKQLIKRLGKAEYQQLKEDMQHWQEKVISTN